MSRQLTLALTKVVSGFKKPDTSRTVTVRDLAGTIIATAAETPAGSGQYSASFTETGTWGYWYIDGVQVPAYSNNSPFWLGAYDVVSGSSAGFTGAVNVGGALAAGNTTVVGYVYASGMVSSSAAVYIGNASADGPRLYLASSDQGGTVWAFNNYGGRLRLFHGEGAGVALIFTGSNGASTQDYKVGVNMDETPAYTLEVSGTCKVHGAFLGLGGTLSGSWLMERDPSDDMEIATKEYVDNAIPANLELFLTSQSSDVGGAYKLTETNLGGSNFLVATQVSAVDTQVGYWLTPTGSPAVSALSEGVYVLHFHAYKSGSGVPSAIKNLSFYATIFRRSGSLETDLATTETHTPTDLATTSSVDLHFSIPSSVTLDPYNDRLGFKVYASPAGSGNTPTCVLVAQGTTYAHVNFTIPAAGNYVKRSGDSMYGSLVITGSLIVSGGAAETLKLASATGGQVNLMWLDGATSKWALYKTAENYLRLYDYAATRDVLIVSSSGRFNFTGSIVLSGSSSTLLVTGSGIFGTGGAGASGSGVTLVAGNSSTTLAANQVLFGYGQTEQYRHAIKTRHDGSNTPANNAIEFYLWTSASVAPAGIPSVHGLSITGVGIGVLGITSPKGAVDMNGNLIVTGSSVISSTEWIKGNAYFGPVQGSIAVSGIYVSGSGNTRVVVDAPSGNAELNLKQGSNTWAVYTGANSLFFYNAGNLVDISTGGVLQAAGGFKMGSNAGATGTFHTTGSFKLTVSGGIITSIAAG